MPGENDKVGVDAELNLEQWTGAIASAIRSGRKLDESIQDTVKSLNDLENKLNGISGSYSAQVNVILGGDDFERRLQAATENITVPIDVSIGNDGEIRRIEDLRSLGVQVDIETSLDDADITRLENIPDQDVDIKTKVDDSELKAIQDIPDETFDLKVNTSDADSDLSEVEAKLGELAALAKIDLILNLPANLQSIVGALEGIPGFGQTIENTRAANVNQLAGGDEQDLAIANDLFMNAFVDTLTEGVRLVAEISRTGVLDEDLPAAAQSTVDLQSSIKGISGEVIGLNDLIKAQSQLVNTGLAGSYAEAADFIATAYQNVPDANTDLLDTVTEYASTFAEAGFTIEEAFSFLTNARGAGFFDLDKAADLVREGRIRTSNPDETAAQDALKSLGLEDETALFQAGELGGAAYFEGILSAIGNVEDKGTQNQLLADIFGTQTEDLGGASILDLTAVNAAFDEIEGRAAELSGIINNDIGVAFQELVNTLNVAAADILSSEAIDLPGKIEAIKNAALTFGDVLQGGGTVGEAIEITLGLPPETFQQFESIFNNLILGLGEIIASIFDFVGNSDAAGTVRAGLADASQGQLAFDLQLATTEEEIAAAVETATRRGVDQAGIGEALKTAFDESIQEGDVVGARQLLEGVQGITGGELKIRNITIPPEIAAKGEESILEFLSAFGQSANFLGGVEKLQTDVDNALALRGVDTTELQTSLTEAENLILTARVNYTRALNAGDLSAAGGFAEEINDPTLIAEVQAFGEQLRATFDSAVNSGDLELAKEVATQLGDESLTAEVDTLIADIQTLKIDAEAELTAIQASFTDLKNHGSTQNMELGTSTVTLKETINEQGAEINKTVLGLQEPFNQTTAAWIVNFDQIAERLNFISTTFNDLNSDVRDAANGAASGGGAPGSPTFAAGGVARAGIFGAGEEGGEYYSTDTDLAILNNKTTQSLLSNLSALYAGQTSVTNNDNRSSAPVIYMNNYITNPAESASALEVLSNAVRGFN